MFTFIYNLLTRSVVVLLVAMLSVNYLPNQLFNDFPFEPKEMATIDYDSVIPVWNSLLTSGEPEYIQLNNILGPESIAIAKNGLIYTGLADGRLVELDPSKNYKVRQVLKIKTSQACKDNLATRATECGRPLQLKFQNETLYMIEANSGLYKIDVISGTKTFVGPNRLSPINLFNSFAFDPLESNIVYITESSTRWDILRIVWGLMELDSSGQIIALDVRTGKRVIIQDNLMMVNGIDVDVEHDRLVFSESIRSRVSYLSLNEVRAAFRNTKDGEKASSAARSTLIAVTPGIPDNIIIDGNIAYIALPFVKPNGKELIDHLSSTPNVRKAYSRFIYGLGTILEYICENIFYHPILEASYLELRSGHINYRLVQTGKSGIIEYNLATGSSRFLGSDRFSFLSEASPDKKGNLYIGSFRNPFIVKVKIPK